MATVCLFGGVALPTSSGVKQPLAIFAVAWWGFLTAPFFSWSQSYNPCPPQSHYRDYTLCQE
jgi:hypothetical protein